MQTLTQRKDTSGKTGMIVKRVSVPIGLEELMEGLSREVILKKPKDLYLFASEYFSRLVNLREKSNHYRAHPVHTIQSVTHIKNVNIPPLKKISPAKPVKHLSRQLSVRGKSPVQPKQTQTESFAKRNFSSKSRDGRSSTDRKDSISKGVVTKTLASKDSYKSSNAKGGTSTGTSSSQSTPREKRQSSVSRKIKSSVSADQNQSIEETRKLQKMQTRSKSEKVKTALITPTVIGGTAVGVGTMEAHKEGLKKNEKDGIFDSDILPKSTNVSLITDEDNNSNLQQSGSIQVIKDNFNTIELDSQSNVLDKISQEDFLDSDILAKSTSISEVVKNVYDSGEPLENLQESKTKPNKLGKQETNANEEVNQANTNQEGEAVQGKTSNDDTSPGDLDVQDANQEELQNEHFDNFSTKDVPETDSDKDNKEITDRVQRTNNVNDNKATEEVGITSNNLISNNQNTTENHQKKEGKMSADSTIEHGKHVKIVGDILEDVNDQGPKVNLGLDSKDLELTDSRNLGIHDIAMKETNKHIQQDLKENLENSKNDPSAGEIGEADDSNRIGANLHETNNFVPERSPGIEDSDAETKYKPENLEEIAKETTDLNAFKATSSQADEENNSNIKEHKTDEKENHKEVIQEISDMQNSVKDKFKDKPLDDILNDADKTVPDNDTLKTHMVNSASDNDPVLSVKHQGINELNENIEKESDDIINLTNIENNNLQTLPNNDGNEVESGEYTNDNNKIIKPSSAKTSEEKVSDLSTNGEQDNVLKCDKEKFNSEKHSSQVDTKDISTNKEDKIGDGKMVEDLSVQNAEYVKTDHFDTIKNDSSDLMEKRSEKTNLIPNESQEKTNEKLIQDLESTSDQNKPLELTDKSTKDTTVTIKMEKMGQSDDLLTVSITDNAEKENNYKENNEDEDNNATSTCTDKKDETNSINDATEKKTQFFREDKKMVPKEDDKIKIEVENATTDNLSENGTLHKHVSSVSERNVAVDSSLQEGQAENIQHIESISDEENLVKNKHFPSTDTGNINVAQKIINYELSKAQPGLLDSPVKHFLNFFINNEQFNVFKSKEPTTPSKVPLLERKINEDIPQEDSNKNKSEQINIRLDKQIVSDILKENSISATDGNLLPDEEKANVTNNLKFNSVKDLLDFDLNKANNKLTSTKKSPESRFESQDGNHNQNQEKETDNRNETTLKNEHEHSSEKIISDAEDSTHNKIFSQETGQVDDTKNVHVREIIDNQTFEVHESEKIGSSNQTKSQNENNEILTTDSTVISEDTTKNIINGTRKEGSVSVGKEKSKDDQMVNEQLIESKANLENLSKTETSSSNTELTHQNENKPIDVDKQHLQKELLNNSSETAFESQINNDVHISSRKTNSIEENTLYSIEENKHVVDELNDNRKKLSSEDSFPFVERVTNKEEDNNLSNIKSNENDLGNQIQSSDNYSEVVQFKKYLSVLERDGDAISKTAEETFAQEMEPNKLTEQQIESKDIPSLQNIKNVEISKEDNFMQPSAKKKSEKKDKIKIDNLTEITSAIDIIKNIMNSKISGQKPGVVDTSVSKYLNSFIQREQSNVFKGDKIMGENKSEYLKNELNLKPNENISVDHNKVSLDQEKLKESSVELKDRKSRVGKPLLNKNGKSLSQENVSSKEKKLPGSITKNATIRRARSVGPAKIGEHEHKSRIPTSARRSANRRPLIRQLETNSKDIEEKLGLKEDQSKINQEINSKSDKERNKVAQRSKDIEDKRENPSEKTETNKIKKENKEGVKIPSTETDINSKKENGATKEDVLIAKTILKGIEGAEKHIELIEEKTSPDTDINTEEHRNKSTKKDNENKELDKKRNKKETGVNSAGTEINQIDSVSEEINGNKNLIKHSRSKIPKNEKDCSLENSSEKEALAEEGILTDTVTRDTKNISETEKTSQVPHFTSLDKQEYIIANHDQVPITEEIVTESNEAKQSDEINSNAGRTTQSKTGQNFENNDLTINNNAEPGQLIILKNEEGSTLQKNYNNEKCEGQAVKDISGSVGNTFSDKKEEAATIIQKTWRGFHERNDLQQQIENKNGDGSENNEKEKDAIMHDEFREKSLKETNAAIKIQSLWRGFVLRKTLKSLNMSGKFNLDQEQATIKIQAIVRGYLERLKYEKLKSKATKNTNSEPDVTNNDLNQEKISCDDKLLDDKLEKLIRIQQKESEEKLNDSVNASEGKLNEQTKEALQSTTEKETRPSETVETIVNNQSKSVEIEKLLSEIANDQEENKNAILNNLATDDENREEVNEITNNKRVIPNEETGHIKKDENESKQLKNSASIREKSLENKKENANTNNLINQSIKNEQQEIISNSMEIREERSIDLKNTTETLTDAENLSDKESNKIIEENGIHGLEESLGKNQSSINQENNIDNNLDIFAAENESKEKISIAHTGSQEISNGNLNISDRDVHKEIDGAAENGSKDRISPKIENNIKGQNGGKELKKSLSENVNEQASQGQEKNIGDKKDNNITFDHKSEDEKSITQKEFQENFSNDIILNEEINDVAKIVKKEKIYPEKKAEYNTADQNGDQQIKKSLNENIEEKSSQDRKEHSNDNNLNNLTLEDKTTITHKGFPENNLHDNFQNKMDETSKGKISSEEKAKSNINVEDDSKGLEKSLSENIKEKSSHDQNGTRNDDELNNFTFEDKSKENNNITNKESQEINTISITNDNDSKEINKVAENIKKGIISPEENMEKDLNNQNDVKELDESVNRNVNEKSSQDQEENGRDKDGMTYRESQNNLNDRINEINYNFSKQIDDADQNQSQEKLSSYRVENNSNGQIGNDNDLNNLTADNKTKDEHSVTFIGTKEKLNDFVNISHNDTNKQIEKAVEEKNTINEKVLNNSNDLNNMKLEIKLDKNMEQKISENQHEHSGDNNSKRLNISNNEFQENDNIINITNNDSNKPIDVSGNNYSKEIIETDKQLEKPVTENKEKGIVIGDTYMDNNGENKATIENQDKDIQSNESSQINNDENTETHEVNFLENTSKIQNDMKVLDNKVHNSKPDFYRSDTVLEPELVNKTVSRLGVDDDTEKTSTETQHTDSNLESDEKDDNNNTQSKEETELESETRSAVNEILNGKNKLMSSLELDIKEAVKNIMENNIDNTKSDHNNSEIEKDNKNEYNNVVPVPPVHSDKITEYPRNKISTIEQSANMIEEKNISENVKNKVSTINEEPVLSSELNAATINNLEQTTKGDTIKENFSKDEKQQAGEQITKNNLGNIENPICFDMTSDDVSSVDSVDSVITVIPSEKYDNTIRRRSSEHNVLLNKSLSHDIMKDKESIEESKKDIFKRSLSSDALKGHVDLIDQVQNTLLDQISGKSTDTASKFDIEQLRRELQEAASLYKDEDEDCHFETHDDELLEYLNDFEPEDDSIYDSKVIRTPIRELPDIEEEDDTDSTRKETSLENSTGQERTKFCGTSSTIFPSTKKIIDNKPLEDHVEILNLEKFKQGHNEIIINNGNIQIKRTESNAAGNNKIDDNNQKLTHTSELHDTVVIPMGNQLIERSTSGNLRHTSEFHDTVVVPLPSGSDVNIKNEARELLAKSKPTEPPKIQSVDSGNQTAFQQSSGQVFVIIVSGFHSFI